MEYRGIEYRYLEWTASSGKKASCYTCRDKSLLRGLGLEVISEVKEVDLKKSIDFYMDNNDLLLESLQRKQLATAKFYKTLNYKGD